MWKRGEEERACKVEWAEKSGQELSVMEARPALLYGKETAKFFSGSDGDG